MAVVEDSSTPVVARSAAGFTSSTLTSASFSPPAGSLLVIMANLSYASAYSTAPTLTCTASAGGAPTTLYTASDIGGQKYNAAGSWYLYLPSAPGAITITLTRSLVATGDAQMMVRVLTGTGTSANLLSGVDTAAATPPPAAAAVTPLAVGSQLYAATVMDSCIDSLAAVSGTTSLDNWNDTTVACTSGMAKAAALTASTSSQTVGFNPSGTAVATTIVQVVEAQPLVVAAKPPAPLLTVQRAARIRSAHF